MRRRDFLYNSSLLLPALLASPSLVMASAKTVKTALLIIHDEDNMPASLASVFNGVAATATQLNASKITRLHYTNNGFQVTTIDNITYVAEKLIVHTLQRINKPQAVVELHTGNKFFPLAYLTDTTNKVTPECWFMKASQMHTEKITPFINRNKHAVLCLSDN